MDTTTLLIIVIVLDSSRWGRLVRPGTLVLD